MSAVSFDNLFFTILPGHMLYIGCPFGHSYGRTYKAQLSSKSRRTEAVFHLNNRPNTALNLKGTYQGFSFFIANSLYMSDFMYLVRTQIISTMFSDKMSIIIIFFKRVRFVNKVSTRLLPLN